MHINKFLTNFRNKFPKSFRRISFELVSISNLLSFLIFLPSKIFIDRKLKSKLLSAKNINKVIIRNDKLGDCVLTLPFIYGSIEDKEKLFFVSKILKEIIHQLNGKCSWQTSEFIKNNDDLLIANLSTSDIENFKKDLPKTKNKLIFTQFSTNFFSRTGFPIVFSPNYLINKSQTIFVKNCMLRLGVDTNPIRGIKFLNNHIENIIKYKKRNLFVIVVGLGIDKGRKISTNNIKKIIKIAQQQSLIPVLLEEPGFESKSKSLAEKTNVESISCKNFRELFILFKSSKYAIGYDCGPMHTASLLTNSIILFSHTPPLHWGKHIWNEVLSSKKFINNQNSVIITNQKNLGSLKKNWLISTNLKGCPLHKKICKNNECSELNEYLLEKAIKFIFKIDA